jgi:hypothetical protein
MSRRQAYGLIALVSLGVVAWPSAQAHALPVGGCLVPTSASEVSTGFDQPAKSVVFNIAPAFLNASAPIRVSQVLQQRPVALPRTVPAGKVYQIQRGTQAAFTRFAAGAALPTGLDCIEVNCPASFPPGTTCWRCVEQVKAP